MKKALDDCRGLRVYPIEVPVVFKDGRLGREGSIPLPAAQVSILTVTVLFIDSLRDTYQEAGLMLSPDVLLTARRSFLQNVY